MEELKPQIGEVVKSKMGRDKDNYFIITEVLDDTFVMIADGKIRRIDKPKKKKIKHLKLKKKVIEKIAEKIKTGKKVHDSELHKALRIFEEESKSQEVKEVV